MESSHKNGMFSLTRNVTECVKILDELIKSKSLHLNQIAIWTSICKYYATEVDLNMNPACSAHLCMNEAEAQFCLLTLHKQCARRSSASEDIHTDIHT